MRKIFIATAAFTAFASTQAYAEAFSGPFVGIDVGYDNGEVQFKDKEVETYTSGSDTDTYVYADHNDGISGNGVAGGIYAGYDMRINDKVFAGVEARFGLSGASTAQSYNDTYTYDDGSTTTTEKYSEKYSTNLRESYSATARVGYLLNDSTGIYLRGGVIEAHLKQQNRYNDDGDVSKDSNSEYNTGFLYGAGIQTAVTDHVSLRVEYNVAQYGEVFKDLAYNYTSSTYTYRSKNTLTDQQVRLGISYGF